MTECEKHQEQISALLDGELTDAERAEVEAHIAVCGECRAMYEAFAAVSGALDAAELPDTLHSGIMEKVNAAAKAKKAQQKIVRLRPILATAACLVVVVGTVFALKGNLPGMGRAKDTAAPAAAEAPMMMMANSAGGAANGADGGMELYCADAAECAPMEPMEAPAPEAVFGSAETEEEEAKATDEGKAKVDHSQTDAAALPALMLRIETIMDSGDCIATVTEPEDTPFAQGEVLCLVADDATEPIAFNLVEGGEYRVFYTEIPESETVRIHAERIELP